MRRIRFFIIYAWAMILTNVKAAAALRASFLTAAGMMALNNVFFLINWMIFFEHFETVGGWDLNDMFVLYGIVSTGFGACVFFLGGARELARLIDEGSLDTWLVQPKPVIASALTSHAHASGIGDMISGLGFAIYAGLFSDLNTALIAVPVMVTSCLVFLGGSILAHSLAFWLGSTYQLSRNVQEYLLLFGCYPGGIHKPWAKALLYVVLPAGLFGWLPVELVQDFTWQGALMLLFGTAAYLGFALWVFRVGLRRYASGSRFNVVA